jgi:hypothetical protein
VRKIQKWIWLILLPAIAGLCGQTFLAIRAVPVFEHRYVILALGAASILSAILLKKAQKPSLVIRFAGAWAAALFFWFTVFELWLSIARLLLARDLFLLAAAACIHATVLSVAMKPATGETKAGRLFLRLELIFCSAMLALFTVEFLARSLIPLNLYEIIPEEPDMERCFYINDEGRRMAVPGFRGHYLHPEFRGLEVVINDWGFRDGLDEISPLRTGELSILVLGDSFTFGTGVRLEETFHERLEQRAPEITAKPLRVYGAGIPGYGPVQALQMLNDLVSRTQPRAVVATFYEGNDFVDNLMGQAREEGITPQLEDAEIEARRKVPRSLRKLNDQGFTTFLHALTQPAYWCGSSATLQWILPRVEDTLANWGIIDRFAPVNSFLRQYMAREPTSLVPLAMQQALIQLAKLRDRCRELGAALVILVIPVSIQAEPLRFEAFLATLPSSEASRYERTRAHDSFVQLLKEEGFSAIDPLPRLESEALAGRSGYHREGHWNAHGHAIAADLLVPRLAEILAGR